MKIIFFLIALLPSLAFSQTFNESEYLSLKSKLFTDAVFVDRYLPPNPDVTGSTDYTKLVQLALNENLKLIFPDFPVLISDLGLKLKSNQSILFQKGSKIVLSESAKQAYRILDVSSVENVNIYFAHIQGDKYKHLNNLGQWGNGISISASKNILIFKPLITACWGDGIYIGNNSGKIPQNIRIDGGYIDDNRRNGISIVSGSSVEIINTTLINNRGQNPQSGIDIEPNNGNNVLENIMLRNILTKNNGLHGIIISTGNLNAPFTRPISITIDRHKDINSKIGLGLSITRANLTYQSPISGTIKVINSQYTASNLFNVKNYKGKKNNVKLIFDDVSVKKIGSKLNNVMALDSLVKNFGKNLQYIIN